MDFKTWYDDADIPTRADDGVWYDAEDGIAFNPDARDIREESEASKKAAEARKTVKAMGGRALVGGSAKQKKWAEELRATALRTLKPETAARVISEAQFQATSWWIDNRAAHKELDFTQHFEMPNILTFQKPLRDLLKAFEFKLLAAKARGYYRQPIDTAILSDCERLLASNSTDGSKFAPIADRIIERLEAL